jgi:hypothetical protein
VFSHEITAFIKDFTEELIAGNAAIFAGAGMSKSCGYVDWVELLHDIAQEIGLDIKEERHDLISLAQFHVNKQRGSAKLAKKIVQEFSHQAEPSVAHEIIARLPIYTYWTTNYDTLIEDALHKASRIPDVKTSISQLSGTWPKRHAVVYKMHGDVHDPAHAVLYKEQYEKYYSTHEPFVTALRGDLVSKTFLFMGFSFTDPNLDYVLSRLHASVKKNHYCFMRKEKVNQNDAAEMQEYLRRKQELRVDDLKRYGIQTLLIDEYDDIPKILREIEKRFLKKTLFISGSAEDYGNWTRTDALNFTHGLASALVKSDFRIVNGFGWGIGSAVINGALEAVFSNPKKHSEDQLVMRPFPQFATNGQNIADLWEGYRRRMIQLAGISIFIFGNKKSENGEVVDANGVYREFEISVEQGAFPIPVGATGYVAKRIADEVLKDPQRYYPGNNWIVPLIEQLNDPATPSATLIEKIVEIVKKLGK